MDYISLKSHTALKVKEGKEAGKICLGLADSSLFGNEIQHFGEQVFSIIFLFLHP